MDIEFRCCNRVYSGRVENLSRKGMLISTNDFSFPLQSEFEIFMNVNDGKLHIPAKLIRMEMQPNSKDEIGAILLAPPKQYLSFIDSLDTDRS